MQLKPQGGVASGFALVVDAPAAPAALKPTAVVTATPAASAKHARVKRLRMVIPSFDCRADCQLRWLGRSSTGRSRLL
jgi:tRNA U38,U39,U40 pseudouridine synthase TruA